MLDNLEDIKAIDNSGMLDILYKFPEQILEVATALKGFRILVLEGFQPTKIIVAGMGGSAIGGDILASVLTENAKLPIITVRDYTLPAIADDRTLVLACSYSGNTEETLSCVTTALERGCKIIGITSGGKLEEFCRANNLPVFPIPKGLPPRAAIAYLFFPMAVILEKLKLVDIDVELTEMVDELIELRKILLPEIPTAENPAKLLAEKISTSIPVIYGHSYLNVIALRWRTQFNENSKMLAMASSFPEMNHNELVGWSAAPDEISKLFTVIILRSADEHPQVTKRIELTKNVMMDKAGNIFEIDAQGKSLLTRMLTTMYLGDYISVYIALLRGINPTPVAVIEELKKKLVE
jgi:glucose/mannose-6-phosphate isomerase